MNQDQSAKTNTDKVFFFQPVLKATIWGGQDLCTFKHLPGAASNIGESWEISGVEGNETRVVGGQDDGKTLRQLIEEYGADFLGKTNLEKYGTSFPLLIKYISAATDLSVQVHPDDAMAQTMGHPYGKTEMWYIISAEQGAQLVSGFSKHISPDDYEKSAEDGSVTQALASHYTHRGDVFYIPAGRIHAIGGGNFLLEIQQSSNDTFRVYDYNRTDAQGNKRELHVEQAKEALDFADLNPLKQEYDSPKNHLTPIVDCSAFTTSVITATQTQRIELAHIDSFSIITAFGGAAHCTLPGGTEFDIESGNTILLPATTQWIELAPVGHFECAEIHIK